MKGIATLLFVCLLGTSVQLTAQVLYRSSYATYEFQAARAVPGQTAVLRFSGAFTGGQALNFDVSNRFGAFAALDVANRGFILRDSMLHKHRVISVGLPIGLRVGNLVDRTFLCFGARMDLSLNYKEKYFTLQKTGKVRFSEFLSDRSNLFIPSVFVGFAVKNIMIQATVMMDEMLNLDYVNDLGVKPYQGWQTAVYTLGLVLRSDHR